MLLYLQFVSEPYKGFVSVPWSPEPSLCFHESCRTWPPAQSCSQPWGFAGAASALSESNTALTGKCLHQQSEWGLSHTAVASGAQVLAAKGLGEASWVAQPCLLLSQAPCCIIPSINSSSCGRKAWNGWGCWKWGVTGSWVRGIGSMWGMQVCAAQKSNIIFY